MDSQETINQVPVYATKAEVIARVNELAQDAANADKQELDLLKQTFYKLHKAEQEAERKAFLEAGGEAEAFTPTANNDEADYKAAMAVIKEARFAHYQEQELLKQQNYVKCLALIDRLKALLEKPEEANSSYNEFKEITQAWRDAKPLPAERANELWKSYQLYREQFYDILKINNEFREYDFKKNLEVKTALCEKAEALNQMEDVVAAFHKLQDLHLQYREAGPVAKELREEVWTRFKNASTTINKRHQQHFEQIKEQEKANLEAKTALCEQIEAIDVTTLKSGAAWSEMTEQIKDIQTKWRAIGFAPQKMNVKIFERFRSACDAFFGAKTEYFKSLKDGLQANLEAKIALCEKAEALKESTDWKKTADTFIALQKEWKAIGAAPKKHSDPIWKRFTAACDYFFEQKNKNTGEQHKEEHENLAKKQTIIENLKALLESGEGDVQQAVRKLQQEWNQTGHVPFKEKDSLYEKYHEVVDSLYKQFNLSNAKRRIENMKNSGGNERTRLTRRFDALRNEIQTYENNICFISSASKKGNSLVTEMQRKVERLKDELELIKEKLINMD